MGVQDLWRHNPPRAEEKASLALCYIGLKEFIKVMGSILYFLKKNDVFSWTLGEQVFSPINPMGLPEFHKREITRGNSPQ